MLKLSVDLAFPVFKTENNWGSIKYFYIKIKFRLETSMVNLDGNESAKMCDLIGWIKVSRYN